MSKLDDILRGIDAGPVSDCCGLPITFDEASRWTCPKCGKSVRDGKNWHTGSNRKQQIKDLFVELLKGDSEVFNSEDAKGQMAIMEWGNELIAKVDEL